MPLKQLSKFLVSMAKKLHTAKSQTGSQSFILALCHWEINPDQDAHSSDL